MTKPISIMTAIDFNEKFNTFTSQLQAFAYKLTNNMDDARDLYQETAFRAFKNMDKFQPETNFKAWLMTIMKNIFINDYRKRVKSSTIFDGTDNDYFLNSGSYSIRNEGPSKMMMENLNQMIEALDEDLRVAFLMNYQGYKYKEIADKFNIPLGTVKSRIFFARKALKEMIEKQYNSKHIRVA